ncbi:hypothetical protein [uncultured Dokdonia sp.]|uniref:hypothetical protein n=1 Tax=uncultured Dokdonia sp. TaxID=575653 RepID=UPI002624E63E|nr:hypothetical protein [uncultured Dokdonia sp.]
MTLDILRLMIDAGFMVLIWAVQLVIYPSFSYYSTTNLYTWHKSYTKRVTFIVLPLMFSQLILGVIQLWMSQNWYTLVSMGIIMTLWLLTFLVFVPLHQSIDTKKSVARVCEKLVVGNWMRTVLWTLLFIASLIYQIMNYRIS